MTARSRLAELGIELLKVATPLAAYVPAVVRTGNLVYTSGQLPLVDGDLTHVGKVGAEITPEEAKVAARDLRAQRSGSRRRVGGHRRGDPGGQGGRLRRIGVGIRRPARRGQRCVGVLSVRCSVTPGHMPDRRSGCPNSR